MQTERQCCQIQEEMQQNTHENNGYLTEGSATGLVITQKEVQNIEEITFLGITFFKLERYISNDESPSYYHVH